jgi:hypothetical protein
MTAVYLMLGVALVGALYWLLVRLNNRQRQVQAELARLEQLAAEVTLQAEGIFDQVDARLAELAKLTQAFEAKVQAAAAAAPAAEVFPQATPAAAPEPAPKKRRGRPKKEQPAPEASEAPEAAVPAARYETLRPRVWALADQGQSAEEIAQAVGLPRGEVHLLLNLRSRQVTA